MAIRKKLGLGVLRQRPPLADLTITGFAPVESLLQALVPYLVMKKNLANLILHIIRCPQRTPEDFLQAAKLVDKVADQTDSKGRSVTSESVQTFFSTRRDLTV